MIGRLNHVAIAVRDLAKASAVYRNTLGAEVSEPVPQPEHGVTTVFIALPNTKIELIAPLGDNSPIAKFLERNTRGGIHHFCLSVDDVGKAVHGIAQTGVRVLGDGKPQHNVAGDRIAFIHPGDFLGALVELEEHNRSVGETGRGGAAPLPPRTK